MAHKILVADDSLTIQKVIGITLGGSDYELVQAHTESEVFNKVKATQFDLILLDFNLSDNKDGYELVKEIKSISSNVRVLVMLGTFDSVDDALLGDAGAQDKIVKPFESSKFVEKCNALLESDVVMSIDSSDNDDLIENGWVLDSPEIEDKTSDAIDLTEFNSDKNELESEIEGWGMEVPSVIGSNDEGEYPPIMEVSSNSSTDPSVEDEDSQLPADDDLDYPDMSFDEPAVVEEEKVKPKLVSLDDLGPDEDESFSTDNEEEKQEGAPRFELEADSDDDIWAPDEIVEEEVSFDDIVHEETPTVTFEEEIVQKEVSFDEDRIVARLKEEIRPMIEEAVKSYLETKAESVAWEIIPDLAENLIRKEIKEISDSVKTQ